MMDFVWQGVVVILGILALFQSAYVVQQAEVIIIERLGKYHRTLTSGLNFIVPFIDQPRYTIWTVMARDGRGNYQRFLKNFYRIDIREAVHDFQKQNVITRDNVTMEINGILYFSITDPKASIYQVANLSEAMDKLAQTTLRNIIGSMDLDETLTSRD